MSDIEEPPRPVLPDIPGPQMLPGKYYDCLSPVGESAVIMLQETWVQYGTHMESMRQMLANQDRRIKELLKEDIIKTAALADVTTRLTNLREVRRNETRPEIEAMFENPPTNF